MKRHTRIPLHAVDSATKGHRRIMLRTVDTDILVLAVSTAACLENTEIWFAFGTGKHVRYIHTPDITITHLVVKKRMLFQCSIPL